MNSAVKRLYRRATRWAPPFSLALFALALICAGLHIAMTCSVAFSDFFNGSVSPFFRALNAKLTTALPFSLAETLIIALPLILALMIIKCVAIARLRWRHTVRYSLALVSFAALIYSMFVLTFAAGYSGDTLDVKLGLDSREVSADELAYTALYLGDGVSETVGELDFKYGGASVMPYGTGELSDKLNDAYDAACDKYDFIQRLRSDVKPIALSGPMTYTHISGVYSFFTGEANINVNYPDYVVAYTAAHELAHQRGIARENEANFVAFLVCLESDDPYIRYSGYLSMFEYVTSALYSANPSYYSAVMSELDRRASGEMSAYSKFFERYRNSVAAEVSGAVNNTYLLMQGTEGTRSYGMVVDLAVAFYMAES